MSYLQDFLHLSQMGLHILFSKISLILFIPVVLKAVRILFFSWSETFKLAVYVFMIHLHYLLSSSITCELKPSYICV